MQSSRSNLSKAFASPFVFFVLFRGQSCMSAEFAAREHTGLKRIRLLASIHEIRTMRWTRRLDRRGLIYANTYYSLRSSSGFGGARVMLRWTYRCHCNAPDVRLPSIVSSIELLFRFKAQWVTNPHPQPFSQAWEKGAEGGLRVDLRLRLDASNLLHNGTLAPIVSH